MNQHIDHIEIKNFKSIRHQKIEGCKRINVFIGYPNTGKSAILEAISALSYLLKDFNESYSELCRFKLPVELFFNGNVSEDILIYISELVRIRFKYLDEHSFDFLVENLVDKSFTQDIFDNETHKWESIKNIKYNDNGVNSKSITDLFDKFNSPFGDLLKVKKYCFQNSYNEFRTNGLVLDFPWGKNLVDIVQSHKELRKEIIELFQFYNLELNIDQRINSMFGFKRLGDGLVYTIPFYQMADTLQRLIFYKAAIMSNKDSVLLFEEPEAHMFPPYISKFTGDIIYEKSNNNQYFLATHSPFVMNDFLENARDELSVYLVGYKNGETIIKRLNDEDLNKIYQHGVDLFFNIESYLD